MRGVGRGLSLHSSLIRLVESSEQPVREGGVVIPILQMWSLRHREVSWFASEIPAQVLLHHQPCGVLAAWRQSKGACISLCWGEWQCVESSQQRIWGQVRNKGSACPPHSNATCHVFSGVLGASKHPVVRKLPTPAAWTSIVARQGPASCS